MPGISSTKNTSGLGDWLPNGIPTAYSTPIPNPLVGGLDDSQCIPENFVLTASRGGRQDELIDQFKMRESKVVFSEAEAEALGYEIDHTDEHAAIPEIRNESFALLIHGVQPKGSKASEAIKQLKKEKVKFSYS